MTGKILYVVVSIVTYLFTCLMLVVMATMFMRLMYYIVSESLTQ